MVDGRVGLFGKLPARGDFVRVGLPGNFVEPWDAWLQQGLTNARARMGERWLPTFLEAPVWRFSLPSGACGIGAVLGLMLPSVDRVGRYFPLTLAAVFPPGHAAPGPEQGAAWLDSCEAAGRAALEQDVTPDQVVALLQPLGDSARPQHEAIWWTSGGPHVAPRRWALVGLPDPAGFAGMIDDSEQTEMPA
ncbi:MAG TPA: type VI secretion system-associated protein TagF [Acetobacteraceae bacterium]|nr:type VI secretion system-associated protein TagF [Acetobacteraceae bacterium]